VRIAYVTESFPPDVNGVAHTAMRVADHLLSRGHQPLVIAPEPASGLRRPDSTFGYPVARVPSVALPLYPGFRIGVPGQSIRAEIAAHGADLVHLAGPFVLGASGSAAARRLGLPVVAVYATDMAAYARAYHTGPVGQAICWRRLGERHRRDPQAVLNGIAALPASGEFLLTGKRWRFLHHVTLIPGRARGPAAGLLAGQDTR